ncbi:MAG TPA: TAT-variant-translocated molybdopterin oxidoreductase [Verrucomicrobiae bacterium]|jgi:molybdopterin-containing oxidoreductase family iron-sulfur binding subunit
MSNISHNSNSGLQGRRYWRGLDELADTPEFKEWLHREFPKGASELTDDVSRRHFLKIMSASFALAGLGIAGAGCRRPVENLVPFGQQPENYTFGTYTYYATAMPARTGAIPLVARSYDGRPIKVEGNALYPGSNGGTDRYAQVSILNLYDPDRARYFRHGGQTVSRDEALKALDDLSQKYSANGGQGLAFFAESSTSPSRARLQKAVAQKFPQAKWFTQDAIDSGIHQRAASQAFGDSIRPVFNFDKAKVILSLDCDFLGGEDGAHEHIRKFAAGRSQRDLKEDGGKFVPKPMNRLYSVESLFTLTGSNADHRLRVSASMVPQIAAAFYALVTGGSPLLPKEMVEWVRQCAADLVANRGNVLVVAGQRQPMEVHLLANAINSVLGSIGNTITMLRGEENIGGSLKNLDVNTVETLIVLGGNPAYHLGWSSQQKPKSVVRLGYYEDETSGISDWHFPAAHYLESWGDAHTADGTLVAIQPLIQPLFGGLTELEFLARIAGESATNPHDIVRATYGDSDEDWKKFLYNGFKPGSSAQPAVLPSDQLMSLPRVSNVAALSASNLEVIFYRDSKADDGFYANNGWMQELPDPITKIVWDNAVLVSRKTARDLNVQNGDLVEISLNGQKVIGPIWTQPGMADYSLGLALGYGRTKAGRVGTDVGFNAYKIFSGKYVQSGATVAKAGGTHIIATTQTHWSMEGRPAVREVNLIDFQKNPSFAPDMHEPEPPVVKSLYPNPLDEQEKTAFNQWGMAVDLTACVGCNTCVVACQSENNIPIVGKDQVLRGREMHWMRIDRYYTADPKTEKFPESYVSDDQEQFSGWIDDVQAVNQPVMCQMCEAAPCENVCPVNATVHDKEGLNVMAYNRCIGTRYCSNNCPYKVRHFNFLDFNKRPLTELKGPYYSTPLTHETNGKWDMVTWWKDREAPMMDEDTWDIIKLSKNPDVTVRMRGVMEKCTYCTQRIEHAKITAKAQAGENGDWRLSEAKGTIPKTACQQACPAGAIVFGDITDAHGAVAGWKKLPQNYLLLGDLLTKPRTSYLARIRNPNPAMPDYHLPFSTEEYQERGGDMPDNNS